MVGDPSIFQRVSGDHAHVEFDCSSTMWRSPEAKAEIDAMGLDPKLRELMYGKDPTGVLSLATLGKEFLDEVRLWGYGDGCFIAMAARLLPGLRWKATAPTKAIVKLHFVEFDRHEAFELVFERSHPAVMGVHGPDGFSRFYSATALLQKTKHPSALWADAKGHITAVVNATLAAAAGAGAGAGATAPVLVNLYVSIAAVRSAVLSLSHLKHGLHRHRHRHRRWRWRLRAPRAPRRRRRRRRRQQQLLLLLLLLLLQPATASAPAAPTMTVSCQPFRGRLPGYLRDPMLPPLE